MSVCVCFTVGLAVCTQASQRRKKLNGLFKLFVVDCFSTFCCCILLYSVFFPHPVVVFLYVVMLWPWLLLVVALGDGGGGVFTVAVSLSATATT